jgi:hypothetical protein
MFKVNGWVGQSQEVNIEQVPRCSIINMFMKTRYLHYNNNLYDF